MATAAPANFQQYIESLAASSPETALKIALTETERQRAIAAEKAEEYRAMSDIEFDATGRIVKASMGGLWRLAQMYAGSQLVPEHYRNKPHDCFIACQMAMRMKVDPFAYMQNSYIVHGRPGLESKLPVAILNTSQKIVGRVKYREQRDAKGKMIACTAYAKDVESGETVESTVSWDMVVAEGWNKQKGTQTSKWMTMPDVMFRYRSAIFLIRAYYPEVLMGMHVADELEDIARSETNGKTNGIGGKRFDDVTAMLAQTEESQPMGGSEESQEVEQSDESQLPDLNTAFAQFQTDLLQTTTPDAARAVYDAAFGPDGPGFPAETDTLAKGLLDEHVGKMKKRGQKPLMETGAVT